MGKKTMYAPQDCSSACIAGHEYTVKNGKIKVATDSHIPELKRHGFRFDEDDLEDTEAEEEAEGEEGEDDEEELPTREELEAEIDEMSKKDLIDFLEEREEKISGDKKTLRKRAKAAIEDDDISDE